VTFPCTELNTTASQNGSNKTSAEFMLQLTGVDLHWRGRGTASTTYSISLPAVLQGNHVNYQKSSMRFGGQSKNKFKSCSNYQNSNVSLLKKCTSVPGFLKMVHIYH